MTSAKSPRWKATSASAPSRRKASSPSYARTPALMWWSPKCSRPKLRRPDSCAPGVLEDLHRLQAGDLVEEPAAGGVHQEGLALQLEQLQCGDAGALLQLPAGVLVQEAVRCGTVRDRATAAVQQDGDAGVARRP